AAPGKPDNPEACYLLAVRYLDAAEKLGATPPGTPLPQGKAERLANDVWSSDARLQPLLSEWKAGQHGGPVEKAFQENLRTLAWTASDYREALRWFRMAEEEQAQFGGRWVSDITAKRKRMEALIASKPGS